MHPKCTENQAGVWLPMERGAKKDWSWVDWMRFLFYRQALKNPTVYILRDLALKLNYTVLMHGKLIVTECHACVA